MITHASFRNFKALKSVDIDFQRLTIIVGPNGSGKTSILEGIDYICGFAADRIERVCQNENQYEILISRGSDTLPKVGVIIGSNGNHKCFELNIGRFHPSGVTDKFEEVRNGELREVGRSNQGGQFSSRLLRLDAEQLRQENSYADYKPTRLAANGRDLASVIAYMKGLDDKDGSFQQIESALRRVIPSVRRIRTDREPVLLTEMQDIQINGQHIRQPISKSVMGDSLIFDFEGANDITAQAVSEGTLMVLALLTVIISTKGQLVLLIDNLDQGLHPKAQMELMMLLRSLLEKNPDLQIIGTVHSPYMLHRLAPNEILMSYMKSDGSAACGQLDKHPEFEKWKDAMTPGEFWSHVGEDWLANGKAVGAAT